MQVTAYKLPEGEESHEKLYHRQKQGSHNSVANNLLPI